MSNLNLPTRFPDEKELSRLVKKKITKENAPIIRNAILSLKDLVEKAYVYIAGLLERVYEDKTWEEWGYTSFQEYVKIELGYGQRKADYLRSIWRRLIKELDLDLTEIEQIPWSKASKIATVAKNKTDARDWIKKAKNMSAVELDSEVKKKRGAKESFTKRSFVLFESQAENVDNALTMAQKVTGSEKSGHNLDMVCLDFLSGHIDSNRSCKHWLKNLERAYKVKIVAMNDANQILWGKKHLDEID